MKWSKDWQMMFNVDKCHIMHLGPNNNKYKYTMEGEELEVSAYEKDIGVIIDSSLKPSLQCSKAAKKANSVLAQLSRAVSYRDKDTFLHLFRTYVRPHLEYCSAAWCQWTKTDKEVLEKVQKRAVGMVTNFKGQTYEEKLAEAGMVTLEERRRRGDLIQAYRVLNKVDNVDPNIWFTREAPRQGAASTRQTDGFMNVVRKKGNHDIRKNFWSNRVVEHWNRLPESVKKSETLDWFKNSIDNLNERNKNIFKPGGQ